MSGADSYELRVWWNGLGDWQLATDSKLNSTSFAHRDRAPGETYYYVVAAVDSDGRRGPWSEQVSVTVPESDLTLAAPDLSAEIGVGQITLIWEEVANAESYILIVWDQTTNDWRGLGGDLVGTTFLHTGLLPDTVYYYHIRAVSAEGHTSEWSEQVSGTADAPRTLTPTVTATPTHTPPTTISDVEAAKERAALVALYEATGGSNWVSSDNWLTDKPVSTWYGVLSDESGYISHLVLDDNGLYGSIPVLDALTQIKSLRLAFNHLTGPIPDLSNLTSLELLYLRSNRLSGSIPSLDSLVNLTHLYLAENELSGEIPDLEALKNLRVLDLGSNQLSGPVPSLDSLANLQTLSLHGNRLSGRIPSLQSLTELTDLDLGSNRLTGGVPSMASLISLRRVHLNDNRLAGQIPSLGHLAGLKRLTISGNELTGRIPRLSPLSELEYLDLSHNQLSGEIPKLSDIGNLRWLDLSHNQLVGQIPDLSAHSYLKGLLLKDNQLSGHAPDLGTLADLAWLDISGNRLTGSFLDLNILTSLEGLILSRNRLTGPIPDLRALDKLAWLDLRDNQFCRSLSIYMGGSNRVVSSHLDRLVVSNCTDTALSGVPGQPRNVRASVVDESVALSWDAAANATGYDLLVWDSFERKWETAGGSGASTTYNHKVQTDGRNYYFRVRARNGDNVRSAWAERLYVAVVPTLFPPPPISSGHDMYFQKYVNVGGVVVVAPSVVSDDQMVRSRGVISGLLANRPDLLQEMAANGATVYYRESEDETVSDWEANAPVKDPHCGSFIQQVAHLMHFAIISLPSDTDFSSRLGSLYRAASRRDSKLRGIGAPTAEDYWAEMVKYWLWGSVPSSLATSNGTAADFDPEFVDFLEDVLGEVTVPQSCQP